jgi:uroporphyrinogen-III synthase
MPNNNIDSKLLHIAITRPLPQGQRLQKKLNNAGFSSICEPLFILENNTNSDIVSQLLNKEPINQHTLYAFIFVSVAAVEFAHQALPLPQWQQQHPQAQFFAVGNKTKEALNACAIINVISPVQQNSEGLLALASLQNVKNKNIIIIRGEQGREYLATQLRNRGAQIHYLSSYKKVWLSLKANEMMQRWQSASINCIVITSIALLKRMINLLSENRQKHSVKSLNDYIWVVASKRIAEHADTLTLKNIIITENASDEAIIASIMQLNDKKQYKESDRINS